MHAILIAGVALVGLPILLHLIMKQEPKRLSFPAFRFLTQKLKTNQRKLRLRHFILLALRMLLIALFCLALYQPTLKSDRLNIRGEQPVATVIIIDTTASMGYTQNEKSRLEEARRRALELLDELPEKSPVAVLTTDEPGGYWQDIPEARKFIEQIDKPRGANQPVTAPLAQAYNLLSAIEAREAEDTAQLPKLIAIFTDRAAASWEAGRVNDLKALREKIPDPKPAHAVVDVGAEQPVNIGIISVEMKPQVIPANQAANITVTVAATGPTDLPPVDAVITATIAGNANPEQRRAVVPYGQSRAVSFKFEKLTPGMHQVAFNLKPTDKLMFDNTRFLTFKVGEARRVLTISDDPDAAAYWQIAINSRSEFSCLVVKPGDIRIEEGRPVVTLPDAKPNEKPEPLQAFEVVCLLSVKDPGEKANNLDSLWDLLRRYAEGGGKLVIIPGDGAKPDAYKDGGNLMPGTLKDTIDTRRLDPAPPDQEAPGWDKARSGRDGVTWVLDDKAIQHPMLRPFQEWKARPNVDAVKYPRRTWKYWDVQKDEKATTVVYYNDAVKPADRHPAVLERGVPDPKDATKMKGRVLLLTTRMDIPPQDEDWHDYWRSEGSSWYVVFPWLVIRYMAGDTADANFNYQTGQSVVVPLPKGGLPRGAKVIVEGGGGFIGADASLDMGDKQTELRIEPPRTNQPGNFKLQVPGLEWRDGFSLNAPADESTLDKVPAEGIEDLTGKGSVVPLGKDLKLRDALAVVSDQPIDLFPWLLILVLMLLALEGLVANRFYRKVK